jgi:hypothetical protein
VKLCLDVPEEVFKEYEWLEEAPPGGQRGAGYRFALIPSAVLNGIGKPQVYDHDYAGCSRREMLVEVRVSEDAAEGEANPKVKESHREHARQMRDAMAFFDRIGWLTPLRLQEEKETGG